MKKIVLNLILLLSLQGVFVDAADFPGGRSPRERFGPPEAGSRAQPRMSLGDAVELVRARTGGRVLDAQAARDGYRVKVLTRQGEVRVIHVDADSGAMQ